MATALFATSYGGEMSPALFFAAVRIAAYFYAGTYFGQKLVNKLAERMDYIRAYDKTAKANAEGGNKAVEPKAPPASFEEYRQSFLEQKAKEFKVAVKDVEATMDATMEAILKRKYEKEIATAAGSARANCEALLTSAEAVKPLTFGQKLKIMVRGAPKN
jgi:hypothetical protein